jgi:hypothetical protein
MQPGFIPDFGYGSIQASSWIEGEPEKNWMGNVKTTGMARLAISTERCMSCGFLELYAKA